MESSEINLILEQAKKFFRDEIVLSHRRNIEKLVDPREFNINPFLVNYLAKALCGNTDKESLAKALIYPRVLGTSITTTMGNKMQSFSHKVLSGFASRIAGLDLEFQDQIDKRRKYCQLKLGPNTLNSDDVDTIVGKFRSIRGVAKQNGVKDLQLDDFIVGVAYGHIDELSGCYKTIRDTHGYPVFIGSEFWERLTGAKNFYSKLAKSFSEVAEECEIDGVIETAIKSLALKL